MSKEKKINVLDIICVNCEELHNGKCRRGYELKEDNCKDYSVIITTPEMYEHKVRENEKDIKQEIKNN
jgi:hypothetical protein